MTIPPRQTLFEETIAIQARLDQLDWKDIRLQFAQLMERAAKATQQAGYEQDDVVVDRMLVCSLESQSQVIIPADWLADSRKMVQSIVHACHESAPDRIRVVGLAIIAVREGWPEGRA